MCDYEDKYIQTLPPSALTYLDVRLIKVNG